MSERGDSSAVRKIAKALRIESLNSDEGTLLGSEEDMLSRHKVSRPTFRQAAALVAQEQLLTIRRGVGGGYFVTRPKPEAVAPPAEQERESIELPKFVSGCRAPEVPSALLTNAATIRIEVEMMIDESGKVVTAKIVQSHPLVPDDLVLTCANGQVFEPAHLPDGTPIPYPFRRRFVFKPAQA